MVPIFATASALLTSEFVDSFEPEQLASKFVKVEKEFGVKFTKTKSTFNIVGQWEAVKEARKTLLKLEDTDQLRAGDPNHAALTKVKEENGDFVNHGMETSSDHDSESKENYEDAGTKSILKTKGNPKRGRHAKDPNKDSSLPEPVVFFQYHDLTIEDDERLNMDTVIDDYEKAQVNKKVTKHDLKKIFEKNTDQMGRPLHKHVPRGALLPPKKQNQEGSEPEMHVAATRTENVQAAIPLQCGYSILTPQPGQCPQYLGPVDNSWIPRTDIGSLASVELANLIAMSAYTSPQVHTECRTYDSTQSLLGTTSNVSFAVNDSNTGISNGSGLVNTSSVISNHINNLSIGGSSIYTLGNNINNLPTSSISNHITNLGISESSIYTLGSTINSLTTSSISNNINDLSATGSSIYTLGNTINSLPTTSFFADAMPVNLADASSNINVSFSVACQPGIEPSNKLSANEHSGTMGDSAMKESQFYNASLPMNNLSNTDLSTSSMTHPSISSSQNVLSQNVLSQNVLSQNVLTVSNNAGGNSLGDVSDVIDGGGVNRYVSEAQVGQYSAAGTPMSTLTTVCSLPEMISDSCEARVSNVGEPINVQAAASTSHQLSSLETVCTSTATANLQPVLSDPSQHLNISTKTKPVKKTKASKNSTGEKVAKTTPAKTKVKGGMKSKKKPAETPPKTPDEDTQKKGSSVIDPEKQSTEQTTLPEQADNNLSGSNDSKVDSASTVPDKDQTFKCTECDYEGKRKKRLTEHMGRVHGLLTDNCRGQQEKTTFPCDQCDKTFVFGKDLNRHKKIVHHGLVHFCYLCNKSYKAKYVFDKHMATHEDGYVQPMFPCQICDRQFTTKFSLGQHVKSEHLGLKKTFICPTCGKSFSQIRSYRQHANVHAGIRPYVCEICNKSFTYDKSLKEHRYMHDNVRRFPCTVCGKAFRQQTCLLIHMKVHKGTKDHICSSCGKGFTQKQSLFRHERIHTGDKPYKCKICSKSFGDYAVIRKHMLMSHKQDKNNWKSQIIAEERKQSDHYVSGGRGYVPRDMSNRSEEAGSGMETGTPTVVGVMTADDGSGTVTMTAQPNGTYISSPAVIKPTNLLVNDPQPVAVPVAVYSNLSAMNFVNPPTNQQPENIISAYQSINRLKEQNSVQDLNTNVAAGLPSIQLVSGQQFSTPVEGALMTDEMLVASLIKQQTRTLQVPPPVDGNLSASLLSMAPVTMATIEQVASQGMQNPSPYLIKAEGAPPSSSLTTNAVTSSDNMLTNTSSWSQNYQTYYDGYQFVSYQNQPDA